MLFLLTYKHCDRGRPSYTFVCIYSSLTQLYLGQISACVHYWTSARGPHRLIDIPVTLGAKHSQCVYVSVCEKQASSGVVGGAGDGGSSSRARLNFLQRCRG